MIATLAPLSDAIAEFGRDRRKEPHVLHERETDLLRFEMTRVYPWYHNNAWGRTSKRAKWRQVWNSRVHISYLAALNEFNDTGAAMADWKSLLELA